METGAKQLANAILLEGGASCGWCLPMTYWSGVGGATTETEDEWADRMWREMQEKRRQKAAAETSEYNGGGP
eukprot:1140479-Pelagomonas_calceolata.AAC.1